MGEFLVNLLEHYLDFLYLKSLLMEQKILEKGDGIMSF